MTANIHINSPFIEYFQFRTDQGITKSYDTYFRFIGAGTRTMITDFLQEFLLIVCFPKKSI